MHDFDISTEPRCASVKFGSTTLLQLYNLQLYFASNFIL